MSHIRVRAVACSLSLVSLAAGCGAEQGNDVEVAGAALTGSCDAVPHRGDHDGDGIDDAIEDCVLAENAPIMRML